MPAMSLASNLCRPAMSLAFAGLVVLLGAAVAGCGVVPASPLPGGSGTNLPVLASTTVFADLVANVGGDRVTVSSLVPRNGDVHTFDPRPGDLRSVAAAKIVFMNGLGLDDWLDRLIASGAAPGTPVVKLAVGLPGVVLLPGDTPDTQNPHLWLDVKNAELYVARIEAALAAADPTDAPTFAANAAAYSATLEQLDARVRARIATIPPENRKLVSFHDAFPYFAREYGITIVGVAVEAPGQDPSAGYTAQLVSAIRAAGVRAIFSERQFPTKLVDAIAAETGATVVANLYDDSLGDPPVTSYVALIDWDVDQLVTALR